MARFGNLFFKYMLLGFSYGYHLPAPEYILATSPNSLKLDAFQKYPKVGELFREIHGVLVKYEELLK